MQSDYTRETKAALTATKKQFCKNIKQNHNYYVTLKKKNPTNSANNNLILQDWHSALC